MDGRDGGREGGGGCIGALPPNELAAGTGVKAPTGRCLGLAVIGRSAKKPELPLGCILSAAAGLFTLEDEYGVKPAGGGGGETLMDAISGEFVCDVIVGLFALEGGGMLLDLGGGAFG